MKVLAALLVLITGSLQVAVGPATAQEAESAIRSLQKDIEALKESQARILKDLEEIKGLLRARSSPGPRDSPSVMFKLTDEPTKGDRNAKLVLVDFTDYQ